MVSRGVRWCEGTRHDNPYPSPSISKGLQEYLLNEQEKSHCFETTLEKTVAPVSVVESSLFIVDTTLHIIKVFILFPLQAHRKTHLNKSHYNTALLRYLHLV